MSLEQEAAKETGLSGTHRPIQSRGDRFARGLAALVLLGLVMLVYWVPFQFLGPVGAAFVLAALTLLAASLASQVRLLRRRVSELERRVESMPAVSTESPGAESFQK